MPNLTFLPLSQQPFIKIKHRGTNLYVINANPFFFASDFYSHTDRQNTALIDIIGNTAIGFSRSSTQHSKGELLTCHGIPIVTIHFQYHANLLQEHKLPYDNYIIKDQYIAITFKLSALVWSSA